MNIPSFKSLLSYSPGIFTLLPVVLFFTMLPLLIHISPLISFFISSILIWFILHSLGLIRLPGKWLRFSLVIISLFFLIVQYGLLFSQKASLTLFCLMLTLKFMEVKNELDRRNIFMIIFLGYFIIITHFLNNQDFFLGLYALINTLILTLLLIAFNRKPQSSLTAQDGIKLVLSIFLKAIPFAIILFLFFPRIPGPLWSLPEDGHLNKTGISDKMYPGSVSELVESDEIAFRIDFKNTIPPADKLYWRGPVLTQTDGFLWSQNNQRPLKKNLNTIVQDMSKAVQYTITLEPTHQKWLFALEMPVKISGDTIAGHFISTDLQIINKNNINQLTQYRVTSMTDFKLLPFNQKELKEALKYPANNPATLALGKQWALNIKNKQKIILQGLNYFKNKPFFYTKRPDIMLDNPSDEFLFNKKRGFCEHFASSFVLLMRAAGIPARVVTGYQGIEKNEVGNYYIVRQSNAHAWAEVWLKNTGWQRVDPTAMIPPERIEEDIFETNLERLSFSSLNIPDLPQLSAQQKTALYNFGRKLAQTLDNLKHSWNKWILGYDKSQQELLLKLMGFSANWQNLILFLMAGTAMLFLIFQLVYFFNNKQQTELVFIWYQKFINKLNKAGMKIPLSEGPESIRMRAIIKFPRYKQQINHIIQLYLQIRYGSQKTDINLRIMILTIKQLKL